MELLVALTILALGGGLSVRVLTEATRELEGAELGLRAVMLLSQGHEGLASSSHIPVGAGTLILERPGSGAAAVRFEPPRGSVRADAGLMGTSGGLRRARDWTLGSHSNLGPIERRSGGPDQAPGDGHDEDGE